jgi:hypothetical protein
MSGKSPVSWVEMPDEAGARALKQLVDGNGTGNVTELSRERGRYRTVRYTAMRTHLAGTARWSSMRRRSHNARAEQVMR